MNSNFSHLQRIQPRRRHNALPSHVGALLPLAVSGLGLLLPVNGSRRGS